MRLPAGAATMTNFKDQCAVVVNTAIDVLRAAIGVPREPGGHRRVSHATRRRRR